MVGTVRLTPVDGYQNLGATRLCGLSRLFGVHRVVAADGQECDVTPDAVHGRKEVRITRVVVRRFADGKDVPQPSILRGMEFLVDVVGRDGEDIEAVELEHVAGAHEVVGVAQLFLHRRRGNQDRVPAPDAGDVVLREVVVVRMGQKDEIRLGVLVHREWIDMNFDPHPSDTHG